MRVIYEPRGKAREYAPLALNIYNGCDHGCKYCYVPAVVRRDRKDFKTKIYPRNILNLVKKDCYEMAQNHDIRTVLLSFTSDPYQPVEKELKQTRKVLEIFNDYGIHFEVLTKGGLLATRDFDLYRDGDYFSVTLTFVSEKFSRGIEPNASLPKDRIESLKIAKEKNITTWVSLEPVIIPQETLELIDLTYKFVDKFKVGKLNHMKDIERKINWKQFGLKAIEKLKRYNKDYYIKKDLAVYI